ncbi:hypothetical protein [Chondrinema litorale]|uniref:hypothetical protein n=1 Tax=Chondrinema litorale TaxID=2994555 RepID=UPI002543C781|nr:hypothetical protein [Chondrinema litorale]UZR97327.1 hypothetical protein OQ292_25840 [Chondrinema litorale]
MSYLKFILKSLLSIAIISLLIGCDEDKSSDILQIELDEQQAAAIGIRGKWGQVSDVELPFGTTPTVLDDLVVEFRIDNDYRPSTFTVDGAEYFFDAEDATWSWEEGSSENIVLSNVTPITSINVLKDESKIRLVFTYSNGRVTGLGEYGCTLTKIAP